jgi:hypothetical protein
LFPYNNQDNTRIALRWTGRDSLAKVFDQGEPSVGFLLWSDDFQGNDFSFMGFALYDWIGYAVQTALLQASQRSECFVPSIVIQLLLKSSSALLLELDRTKFMIEGTALNIQRYSH